MTLDKRLCGIQTLKRKRNIIWMEVLADGLLEIIQTIANCYALSGTRLYTRLVIQLFFFCRLQFVHELLNLAGAYQWFGAASTWGDWLSCRRCERPASAQHMWCLQSPLPDRSETSTSARNCSQLYSLKRMSSHLCRALCHQFGVRYGRKIACDGSNKVLWDTSEERNFSYWHG